MTFNWFNNETYLSSQGQDHKIRYEKMQLAGKVDCIKSILLGTSIKGIKLGVSC